MQVDIALSTPTVWPNPSESNRRSFYTISHLETATDLTIENFIELFATDDPPCIQLNDDAFPDER